MRTSYVIIVFSNIAIAGDNLQCYDYLADAVRSSNYEFIYATSKDVNVVIDSDNGKEVSMQLSYDTDGSGSIGWATYIYSDASLWNASAYLEDKIKLKYDESIKSKLQKFFDVHAPLQRKSDN
ncbi:MULTISPECIES: hypothetical protein [Aeromonas]|uniref:hypothetical protein n=1 Tax=Aeromonas TaxID=642 RepID=UPI00159A8E83|nr:hypothetical protein [Aeromonas dhakensis]MBW3691440.1 hypothetical protein [Aeromonas dhakensis]QKF99384.1 hypothetical protein HQK30_09255 [Aeromonas hydrophila]HDX8366532.1 hypothetical protein [Aeromonas dhakensis]